jgi:Xaa-Pro aminopeptidase
MNTPSLARLNQLKAEMNKAHLDACLIEDPLDLLYLTGLKLSAGRLLVHKTQIQLLVDGRYFEVASKRAPCQTLLDGPQKLVDFCQQNRVRVLGFDGRKTSYERFLAIEKSCKQTIQLKSFPSLFKSMRAIKDQAEIVKMKKSAALLWKGFEFIKKSLKKGVTEKELSKAFEIFCLQHGADRLSFEPIIAFGANSAMPHYRSQNAVLKEGIVLIDIGVVVNNYHSDMTRVVFYKKSDPHLRRLYEIVQKAQKAALQLCKPGVKVKDLDLAARQVMREEQVEDLFIHSLGHGIGLETHEFPRIKYDGEDQDVILQSGMVFTVEPGLYVPGKGGVRYEDTIVITSNGYKNFYTRSG